MTHSRDKSGCDREGPSQVLGGPLRLQAAGVASQQASLTCRSLRPGSHLAGFQLSPEGEGASLPCGTIAKRKWNCVTC